MKPALFRISLLLLTGLLVCHAQSSVAASEPLQILYNPGLETPHLNRDFFVSKSTLSPACVSPDFCLFSFLP